MNEHNPYAASSAALERTLPRLDIDSAPKGRRFLNWLIDKLVIYGMFALLGVVLAFTNNLVAIEWFDKLNRLTDMLLTWTVLVTYYTVMEGAFGFTIGKLITNTRVVDEYGQPPSFRKAFLRSLCRLIPFDALSLLMSDEGTRRGWHDSLPKTYVVTRPRRGAPVGKPRHSVSEQFGESAVSPAQAANPIADPL
ncbi:RDD family protein [Lysobacter terrae]